MTAPCPHKFKGQGAFASILLSCRYSPEIQPHRFNGWISHARFQVPGRTHTAAPLQDIAMQGGDPARPPENRRLRSGSGRTAQFSGKCRRTKAKHSKEVLTRKSNGVRTSSHIVQKLHSQSNSRDTAFLVAICRCSSSAPPASSAFLRPCSWPLLFFTSHRKW